MQIVKAIFCGSLFLFASSESAAQTAKEAFGFLTTHIENKTFSSEEAEFVIEPGRLIGVSAMQRVYKNVTVKNNTLAFNIISIKKQTNYRLDDAGNRILPGKVEDSVSTKRCIITERKSTKQFLGICFSEDVPGYETAAQIYLGDAEGIPLTMIEKTATAHADGYAATDSGYKPVSITTITSMILSTNTVELAHTETGYDVDITTGQIADQPYASVERRYSYAK